MGSDSGPGQEETKDSGPPMQQSASGQDESEPMVIDGANSEGPTAMEVSQPPASGGGGGGGEEGATAKPPEKNVRNYFRAVHNDGTPENNMLLMMLKNIFAKQLPKMPREYIVRLVFDRRHRSIALMKGPHVIGGICYRPYYEQRFAEIAFCAIKSEEQVKGFGTRLMNHLKESVKRDGILYFLTYADNYAVGYFRKQGFSKTLTFPKPQWQGFIKDYDGAHLMECFIHPTLNYLDRTVLARQRDFILSRINEVAKSQHVYPGIHGFRSGRRLGSPLDIPGVKEAGWTAKDLGPQLTPRDADREKAQLREFLQSAVRECLAHRSAWPFKEPVDTTEVEDYTTIVSDPIDLSLIQERLKLGDYYRSREMLHSDLVRMCRNCKTYNQADSEFYAAAVEMEGVIRQIFKKVGAEEDAKAARPRASE